MFVIPSICANFKTTIMKRLFYLTIIILSVFASCKDDVETPKYSLDENGDVVVANDNKALRTAELFNSVVCGHCWKITNKEFLVKGEEWLGYSVYTHFFFEADSCTIYGDTDNIPFLYKFKKGTNYDENTGKLKDKNNKDIVTIISINADNTITAFKKEYTIKDPVILTLTQISEEEQKKLDSDVEKMKEYYSPSTSVLNSK